jgi:hypothetical protein
MKKKTKATTVAEVLAEQAAKQVPVVTPKIGAYRLQLRVEGWQIQQYGHGCIYGFTFPQGSWLNVETSLSLWGIKRRWKKLFGTSKPFPSFTVWTSEEVV